MLTWLTNAWAGFEAWVYSWMPGWKHFIVTGLGFIGSTAAVLQTYVTGLPLDKLMTATQVAVATIVISLLALWFGNMGNRVNATSNT